MLRTRVGYCGGTRLNPSYYQLGDHSEALQIDFDPRRISYDSLLKVALDEGSFSGRSYSRQYRSAVFFHSPEQELAARQRGISEVEPMGTFTRAEDYHQKYYLQQQSQMAREMLRVFPDDLSFTDSTTTAKMNAAVGGWLSRDQVQQLLPRMGLSKPGEEMLLRLSRGAPSGCSLPTGR